MNRAPKLNRDRLQLLTGAAGVVLGESHPTTQALGRAITTWGWQDISRARAQVRQLDTHLRALLDCYRHVEVHNEGLADELSDAGPASHHAPLVAEFAL